MQRFIDVGGATPLMGLGDYGSTSRANFIKGSVRTPIKGFRQAVDRTPGARAVYVPEPYTSVTCSRCNDLLINMRTRTAGSDRLVKVHQVLHCRNSVCSNTTVHRDVDAACSILEVFFQLIRNNSRPSVYCHQW